MRSALSLALIISLAIAQAHERADRDWVHVQTLELGTEVMVTVMGSKPVRRSFVRADESGLWVKAIDRDQGLIPIARADVVEISQVNKPGRAARNGALIGFAAGSGFWLIPAVNCRASAGNECAGNAAAAFALYAGIGAAVGALIGACHQREQIIYRAP